VKWWRQKEKSRQQSLILMGRRIKGAGNGRMKSVERREMEAENRSWEWE
jgi:hypothetical protein